MKQNLSITLTIAVILLIVLAGLFAFRQLKTDEEAYKTDLFCLIPSGASSVIDIQNIREWREQANSNPILMSILPETKTIQVAYEIGDQKTDESVSQEDNKVILAYYPTGTLLLAKSSDQFLKKLQQGIFKKLFSSYPPNTKEYKNTTIYIQSTTGDDFFCYVCYRGAFIGSYDLNLVMRIVDSFEYGAFDEHGSFGYPGGGLQEKPEFKACLEVTGKGSLASLFIAESPGLSTVPFNKWIAGDLDVVDNELWLGGVVSNIKENTAIGRLICQEDNLQAFSTEFIPDSIIDLISIHTDSIRLASLLGSENHPNFSDSVLIGSLQTEINVCHFTADSLKKCTVAFMKINQDKFTEGLREEINRNSPERKEVTNHLPSPVDLSQYPMYETSQSFGFGMLLGDLLPIDSSLIFTFHDNYLIVGDRMESVSCYIREMNRPDSVHVNPVAGLLKYSSNNEAGALIVSNEKAIPHQNTYNQHSINKHHLLQLVKRNNIIYFNWLLKQKNE